MQMIVVIDTNVLISALIRDSATRRIIINSGMEFYYPEASLHELRKYKSLILDKSGLSEIEYEKIMNNLFGYITLIPTEKLNEHSEEARKIIGKIDPDDVVFIAAAICYEDPVIWSDDRHFDKQGRVKVLKTSDMIKILR